MKLKMIKWLSLTKGQRLATLRAASAASGGIPMKALEKDWWVTLVLKAIFQTQYAPYLLFKGGTSLSKCWKLIERFSEDIDLALDRNFIANDVPHWGHTQIKKLKKQACAFTSNELKNAVEQALYDLGVPEGMVRIEAGAVKETVPDKDPQELLVHYESVTDKLEYVDDPVKIEVSARSLKEPWQECTIQSLVDEHLPSSPYTEKPFAVPAVEPSRTFWEKIFLLHEEFQKEHDKIRHFRMSRHFSDLFHIRHTNHGKAAIADEQLFNTISQHREQFSFLPWVDYSLHRKGRISFLPPTDVLMAAYRKDYESMSTTMFYGSAPPFDKLIKTLRELQNLINGTATPESGFQEEPLPSGEELAQLIEQAKTSKLPANAEREGFTVSVFIAHPVTGKNKGKGYYIHLLRQNGELVYQNIERVQ
jgi:hypothetical protein